MPVVADSGPSAPTGVAVVWRTRQISITPSGSVDVDREMAQRYADLGVQRLVLRPPRNSDAATPQAFVSQIGDTLVGRV